MTDLESALRARVARGEKMLSPFITAGFPDLAATGEILRAIDSLGLGCVEIGIPFSDPVADGPVIQASFGAALAGGLTVEQLFAAVGSLKDELVTPRVAMVSFSIAYHWGVERFLGAAAEAGLAGVLFPDLPMGAEPRVAGLAERTGLANILLAAPTSSPARRRRIAAASTGYVYYLSVAGITGERDELPADLAPNVRQIKSAGRGKPVFVGFGISRPEQVAQVAAVADGAIVGSGVVRRMAECVGRGASAQALAERVRDYVADLCGGLKKHGPAPRRR